jgi:divalent metal cation (Fe/Co/Zn/Cd) transporter
MSQEGPPPDVGSDSEQRVAVITALVANVAVALAKLGAFAVTRSSAMLAESLHSFGDSVNEVPPARWARVARVAASMPKPACERQCRSGR